MYLNMTPARRELLMTALRAVHDQNYLDADPADRAEYDRLYVELSAMTIDPVPTSPLPSLADFNKLTCGQNVLALLRSLNTSDLVFMYMLFDASTLDDICRVCTDLLDTECRENACALTDAELLECRAYIRDMLE